MPDAQPKPTAAEVLGGHRYARWKDATREQPGGYGYCQCGQRIEYSHPQHQADMLAAAGLLATAEHDAKMLRDAAEAWQYGGWADDMPKGVDRTALILGMAQRAAVWLRARAARIAAGETP
jgi:hypothetical protein